MKKSKHVGKRAFSSIKAFAKSFHEMIAPEFATTDAVSIAVDREKGGIESTFLVKSPQSRVGLTDRSSRVTRHNFSILYGNSPLEIFNAFDWPSFNSTRKDGIALDFETQSIRKKAIK